MLTACYLLNKVPNKRNKITLYKLWTKRKPNLNYLRVCGCRVVVRLPDLKLKTLGERGIECIFVDMLSIPRILGTRDEVSNQYSYYFNVEDDLKTFDEAMKSQDVTFWKEAINDEMDSIMGNNTWVLADLPSVACISTIRQLIAIESIHNLIIHQMDVKTAFLNGDLEVYMNQPHGFIMPDNENKVCKLIKSLYGLKQAPKIKHESNGIAISQSHYIEKILKKLNYFYCTPVSTLMDTSKKLMPNNGQAVSQLEYSRVSGCLMYAMTCTKPDIAFVGDTLMQAGATLKTIHLQVAGYSYLVVVQFLGLPKTPISICCDSDATLAKTYSQIYNEKSRHLGVRQSMIRALTTNGDDIYRVYEVSTKLSWSLDEGTG
nr:hypothetical protein [Tanacetum cinerariifolium]